MTLPDHPRRADIDQYRAEAAKAAEMGKKWKGTQLGEDWDRVAKAFTLLADDAAALLKH